MSWSAHCCWGYCPAPYWGAVVGTCGGRGWPAARPRGGPAAGRRRRATCITRWGATGAVTRTSGGYNAWTGNAWSTQVGHSYNSVTGPDLRRAARLGPERLHRELCVRAARRHRTTRHRGDSRARAPPRRKRLHGPAEHRQRRKRHRARRQHHRGGEGRTTTTTRPTTATCTETPAAGGSSTGTEAGTPCSDSRRHPRRFSPNPRRDGPATCARRDRRGAHRAGVAGSIAARPRVAAAGGTGARPSAAAAGTGAAAGPTVAAGTGAAAGAAGAAGAAPTSAAGVSGGGREFGRGRRAPSSGRRMRPRPLAPARAATPPSCARSCR